MNRAALTLLIAGGCLVAGGALISVGKPVDERPAADVLAAGPRLSVPSPWRTYTDTIKSGEALLVAMQRAGLSSQDAAEALKVSQAIDPRRIRAGTEIVTKVHADSGPAEISFHLAIDRIVHLRREAIGWTEHDERVPWLTDTVAIASDVRSSLVEAVSRGAGAFPAAMRLEMAYALADILEYRVDLSRDLQKGDSVYILLERKQLPSGVVKPGDILAARITVDGRPLQTVRFSTADHRVAYYDGEGKSMRAAFLRAPLAFRRISSNFGMRRHPILNTVRKHQGMDYAASSGTPVRAIGDGVVIFAGVKGGYGRTVELRHRNGMVTRYAHLSRFGAGIKRGKSVSISNTIGYVGATGLATAPHLHFEVLMNGVHRDPRVALRNVGGEPLAAKDRDVFLTVSNVLFAQLDAAVSTSTRFATNADDD